MAGTETGAAKPPLEDLMVAMDVVDTLRHRDQLIDREMDSGGRRERLIEQLRDIYAAQGIEVTDELLAEGVLALEQDRFGYKPPEPGFSTSLARAYVHRDRWLRPLLITAALLALISTAYYMLETRPQAAAHASLPGSLNEHYSYIAETAQQPEIQQQAQQLHAQGQRALAEEDYDKAAAIRGQLAQLQQRLESSYSIRVVNQPGQRSGVYRIPDVNSGARNYYIVVEAFDAAGNTLRLPISNEETGKTKQVSRWGLRVDRSIYERIGADKSDDGIIQQNSVGRKASGYIGPDYSIPTSGATITDW